MTPTPPVKHLWRNFWMLLKPFWASKEGKAKGLLLLVIVLALNCRFCGFICKSAE